MAEENSEHIPTVIIPMEPVGSLEGEVLMNSEGGKFCLELTVDKMKVDFPFDPEKGKLTIGRGGGNGIQILAMSVSREQHAEISYNGSECMLKHVDGKNGTYVNGIKLGERAYALRDNDKIRFGAAELVYREKKD